MKARSLSLSQIIEYATCGKKWQLKRIAKKTFEPSVSMAFGKALHAGLELFNNDYFIHKSNPVDVGAIKDLFEEEFEKEINEDALRLEYEKIQRQKNSRKALKNLTFKEFKEVLPDELRAIGHSHLDQYIARKDHGDEHLIIEEFMQVEYKGIPLRFIIDLLDVKDGKVRLRDYKTRGKSDKKLATLQLTGYAWLLKEYKEIEVQEIEQINFIKSVKNPKMLVLNYDIKDLEQDYKVFQEELDMFISGIEAGIFARNRESYCTSCEVRDLCYNPDKEREFIEKVEEATDQYEQEGASGMELLLDE